MLMQVSDTDIPPNLMTDSGNVEASLQDICKRYPISNATYHMAQTVVLNQNVDAPFVKTTYPDAWVARYFMKGYVNVDPIVKEGMLRSLPFDWSQIEPDEDAFDLLSDFQAHGLGARGYSIPLTDKIGRRALFSLNSSKADENSWDEIVLEYMEEWAELGYFLHHKAIHELYGEHDPAPSLSGRELETLNWVAQGKDHKEIARILGVSEHTIRSYMQSLRYKLACSSMTQAVAKASTLRIINPPA